MKWFYALLLLLTSLLRADWEQLLSLEEDPSLCHHVNVITGNLNLSIEDAVVEGPKSLSIMRTYSSAGALERTPHNYDLYLKKLQNGWHIQGGWNYFPHANLLIEPGSRKEEFKAYLPEKGGNLISYAFSHREDSNKYLIFLKPQPASSVGHFSARTDPQNNLLRLNLDNGEAHLFLPDGGERRYVGPKFSKYKKRRLSNCYYHLIDEYTPSKHKIFYIYNDKAHLQRIEYLNPASNKAFSWVEFHNHLKKPFKFHLKTSDSKQIVYKATEHEEREYLNYSSSSCRAKETIKYTPGRKGIGARLHHFHLDNRLQFAVTYHKPSNKKEHRKWHDKPDTKDFSADKVLKIEAPVGAEILPLAQFTYHSDYTEVRDVENLLTRYRHKNARLESIEYFDRQDLLALVQKIGYEGSRISSKSLWNAAGEELFSKTFRYDALGNILEETLWGNLTGEGRSSYTKEYEYLPHFNLPLLEKEENGLTYRYSYQPHTDLLTSKLTYIEGRLTVREFFFYDTDHLLIAEIIDDGSSLDPHDLTNATQRLIQRYHRDPHSAWPTQIVEAYFDFKEEREVMLKRRELTYDRGKVSQETIYDANNQPRYTLYTKYNGLGKIISQTTPLGEVNNYRYNNLGHLLESKEVGSSHKRYTYNASGSPLSCEEIGSNGERKISHSTYDSKGRLLSQTDFKGNSTLQHFDAFGRCISTQFPLAQDEHRSLYHPTVYFTYDERGNITSTTTLKGEVTRTLYNALGKPTRIIQADGSLISHTYHKNGTLATTTYPDNTLIRYTYDPFQRMISKTLFSKEKEILSQEEWHYSASKLLSHTFQGLTTHYSYDGAGRVIQEETEGRIKSYHYDSLGFLEKTIEGERAYCQQHDLAGRVIAEWSEELPTGHIENHMRFFYTKGNHKEKVIRQTSQGEAIDSFTYDDQGRILTHTDPLGEVTEWIYNEFYKNELQQFVLQKTHLDPLKNATIETFDASNRLTLLQKKNPQGELVAQEAFFYDVSGNRKEREITLFHNNQPIEKRAIYWEYDLAGRVTQEREGHKITTYHYDLMGRVAVKELPSGILLHYRYDGLNRLTELSSSDQQIYYRYSYDKGSKPISIQDLKNSLQLRFTYNPFEEITQEINALGGVTEWSYDTLGRRNEMILPDRSSIRYNYLGSHLTSLQKRAPSGQTLYEHRYHRFDPNGHVASESLIYPLGELSTSHDLLERPSSQSSPWMASVLTYDPAGRVIQHQNSLLGDKEYLYDPLGQLLQEGDKTYHFDSLGNSLSHQVNELNELLSTEDSRWNYNANGYPIERTTPQGTLHYTYDALGRLTSMASEGRRVCFLYDPLSRLYSKEVYAKGKLLSQEYYLYDHQIEIGKQTLEGAIYELKVLGLGIKGDLGAAVALELNNEIFAPLHDLNGHLIALINSQGDLVESYSLDAFGKESASSALTPWRFSSKRHEEGLVFFGERFYDPSIGRWLTPDPSGYSDGPNLYLYLLNSPLNRLDLFGLSSEWRAPQALPDFRIEVPTYKITPLTNYSGFITADSYFNGKGPDKIHFGCDWGKLHFTPEELKVGRVNMVDHFHEIIPKQGSTVGVISLINGINVSKREFKSYGNYLYRNVPELSEGLIYLGLYNKSRGLWRDFHRLSHEVQGEDSSAITRHRQYLVAFSEHLKKINPQLLWLHLSHSEGGIITRRAIETMTPDQQHYIKENVLSLSLGSVAPIPKEYAKETLDLYSTKDYAAKWYMSEYKDRERYNIRYIPCIASFNQRILGLVDHNWLSPTYGKGIKNHITVTRDKYGLYSNPNR